MNSRNLLAVAIGAGALLLAMASCGEDRRLTKVPVSIDIYVDSTLSNNQVALQCMDDVMETARLAAESRGYLEFHAFDGDPFWRRGLSEAFAEVSLPGYLAGSTQETNYLEELAEDLREPMEELVEEPPAVAGTPLIDLLERTGRHTSRSNILNRVLICTDGLFTDVSPRRMTRDDAKAAGEALPLALDGVTVDFIGLGASAPGRGPLIEATKPLVRAMLTAAGARLGNWELELPFDWRKKTIEAAELAAT